jgi:hypothetical protein
MLNSEAYVCKSPLHLAVDTRIEKRKKPARNEKGQKRWNPLDFADGLRWNCSYNHRWIQDADAVLHVHREREHWRADAVMCPYVIRSFYSKHPPTHTHARHEPNSVGDSDTATAKKGKM